MHDSPDYYQLKLSVFNDDKKTDLIGETWIDLRDIIVPGGGQSDHWHTLGCKGKYAGEIRIETTFYDSRPKPEKPAPEPKVAAQANVASEAASPSALGGPRTLVKRRPLPTDPSGRKQPERVESGPRPQPPAPGAAVPKQPPLQAIEHTQPPPPQAKAGPMIDEHSTSPFPESHYSDTSRASPRRSHEDQTQRQYHPKHMADPRSSFGHEQPEFDAPPPIGRSSRHSFGAIEQAPPPPPPAHRSRGGSVPSHEMVHRASFDPSGHKAAPPMMRHDVLRNEAHRHSVSVVPASSTSPYPGRPMYRPYDSAPEVPSGPQYHEPERQYHPSSSRHHSYDPAYDPHGRSMQPTVEDVPESWTPPKPRYGQQQEARTPPNPRASYQRTSPFEPAYEEDRDRDMRMSASPAPLNVSGRGSATSNRYQTSPSPAAYEPQSYEPQPFEPQSYESRSYESRSYEPQAYEAPDYHSMSTAIVPRGYHHASMSALPDPDYSQDPYITQGNELALRTRQRSADFSSAAAVPATLIPGFNPSASPMQEITERIYDDRRRERRYTQPAPMTTPTRGRQHDEHTMQYANHSPRHSQYQGNARPHDRSPPSYRGGSVSPGAGPVVIQRHRGVSPVPNPSHTIKRKSVSPAPPPAEERSDGRRLSGIPFGPDDYDELNPAVVVAKDAANPARQYTNQQGKIVTSDGREVDPSDHLAEDTWAPEPEPKQPPSEDPRARPAMSGAHPMPASNYKNIRVTVRPHSMAHVPTQATAPLAIMDRESPAPLYTPASSRNRLQKKPQHRTSALPAPISGGTSPLGPASSHQRNSTPPRALVRASTFDYENHVVPYNAGQGAARGGYGNAPPIPAKIPVMSGGMGPGGYGAPPGGGNQDWALMQEMSQIDLGSGRARRHAGGY